MKRTVVSFILAVCLIFGIVGMTGCAYNWDNSAQAVTLDLNALKGSKIDAYGYADDVTAKLVLDAYHDLLKSNGTAKATLEDGEVLKENDEVTLSVKVKRSLLLFETSTLYTKSSFEVDLEEYASDGSPVDAEDKESAVLEKLIAKDMATRITAGEELKVGETYTFSAPLKMQYNDANKDDKKDDSEYKFTATDDEKHLSDIEYTVTAASSDADTVVVGNTDVIGVYFTKKASDGSEVDTDYNWRFTSISASSVPSSAKLYTYDPYYTADVEESAKSFFAALAAEIAAGNVTLDEAPEYRETNDRVSAHDWVEVTLTLQYIKPVLDDDGNPVLDEKGEPKTTTVDIKYPVTSLKTDLFSLSMSDEDFDKELDKNKTVYSYVRKNILAHLNDSEGDGVQKVGDVSAESPVNLYKIPTENFPETIYVDDEGFCFGTDKEGKVYEFYDADDAKKEGVLLSGWTEVKAEDFLFQYTISGAKGAEWSQLAVTEVNKAEGEETESEKVYTYDYYVYSVTELTDELTLEDLVNSTFMNKNADEATDARYFYAYSYDETELDENGEAVLDEEGNPKTVEGSKIYANSNYALTLFKTVEQEDESLKYYAYDEEAEKFSETEGLALMDGVIAEGETVDAEKRAVLYAIQRCLERDERAGCIRAIWDHLAAVAEIKLPQELLDQYYEEYYQNARYTFFETNKGSVTEKVSGTTVTTTDFTAYLMKQLGITDETKIREKIDELAEKDLSPRLLAHALADMMGIEITDEDRENINANLEYGRQQNNYYYALYAAYGIGGYEYYDNVEEYAIATYGSMEGLYTAVLHDKVLEALYDDEDNTYNFTYEFEKDPADK